MCRFLIDGFHHTISFPLISEFSSLSSISFASVKILFSLLSLPQLLFFSSMSIFSSPFFLFLNFSSFVLRFCFSSFILLRLSIFCFTSIFYFFPFLSNYLWFDFYDSLTTVLKVTTLCPWKSWDRLLKNKGIEE